jgi:hypothetical protein
MIVDYKNRAKGRRRNLKIRSMYAKRIPPEIREAIIKEHRENSQNDGKTLKLQLEKNFSVCL